MRASDERPYRIVRTIAMLRSGIICFFTLQTVCPTAIFHFPFSTFNLNKLPLGHNMFLDIYKLSARIGYGGSPCGRPMNAPTGLCEQLHATLGHNMFFYITDCMPDRNFPFSIFNLNKLPLGRNVLLILQTIMHNAQKNVKNFTNI